MPGLNGWALPVPDSPGGECIPAVRKPAASAIWPVASAFADAMKHFAQGTETGALGPRLADALDPIKAAAALGDGDRLLRAFLTAAPMSPFASLTKNWQNVTPSR
ncbi:MAG: hypothetical protein AAEJ43_04585, partial [Gammaproteobacteria bacterium]